MFRSLNLSTHFYCNGLTECPITVPPFIMIQHAHFCCKHSFASLCLQIEHMHASLTITSTVFCCFDFTSTYNHSATTGTPIMKKTMIVRIGTRSTNNEMPKITVPIPRIESQRAVISMLSPIG